MEAQMYKRKKVLVTGGASFIGSHLVDALVKKGAIVTVVDDFSSGEKKNLSQSLKKIRLIRGDLRDQKIAQKATKNQDIVFHLANAHGGRGYIETHPAEISQNMLIDSNVLLSSYEAGVNRYCYISSACVYPTNLQTGNKNKTPRFLSEEMADPFKEGAALADGEYGWAKFMGEMSLKAYHKQYGMKGVSCRLFTVYGPRENETHAIIAFIARALLKQDPYVIWGSGKQDRNFTYVSDIVDGLMLATQKITDCRSINIGTDEIITIKDAVKTVCKIVGHKPKKYFFDKTKPEGVRARAASTKNQEKLLNWKPKISFEEGIRKTIDWYKEQVDLSELKKNFEKRLFER